LYYSQASYFCFDFFSHVCRIFGSAFTVHPLFINQRIVISANDPYAKIETISNVFCANAVSPSKIIRCRDISRSKPLLN
jgi:hypothetical protein